jgi:hypothetical protein
MNIKLFILIALIFIFGAFFIIPKTGLAKKIRMNESLYMIMNIIGALSGITGLFASFIWGDYILTSHYYELILLPVFIIFLYSLLIIKIREGEEPYDEKQELEMTRAAALTLPFSFIGMFFIYAMYKETVITGLLWFPVYIFLTITVYSSAVIIQFRRG